MRPVEHFVRLNASRVSCGAIGTVPSRFCPSRCVPSRPVSTAGDRRSTSTRTSSPSRNPWRIDHRSRRPSPSSWPTCSGTWSRRTGISSRSASPPSASPCASSSPCSSCCSLSVRAYCSQPRFFVSVSLGCLLPVAGWFLVGCLLPLGMGVGAFFFFLSVLRSVPVGAGDKY